MLFKNEIHNTLIHATVQACDLDNHAFDNQDVVGIFFRLFLIQIKKSETQIFFESLILAQDERWRRALGMQVERE